MSQALENLSDPAGWLSAEGDVAVVTGAARGIGLGIAERLLESGYRVVLIDRDQNALREAKQRLAQVSTHTLDLADAHALRSGFSQIEEQFGRIDVLVNNAGIVRDKRFLQMTDDDWDTVLSVNLRSQFLCARAVLAGMVDRKYGRIVNLSSRAWLGSAGQASYSAAKGGVVSLTRTLALEFGRYGITVNAIAPGIVDTPLFRDFKPELQEKLAQSVPVRRIGTASDIALAVEFFAKREASYVTGQLLYVCGGRSLASHSV